MMESFPVLSYKIDYIKFYTPVKNEVKCTIVMQKGESGTPIATSSWYFKLMNYLGGWRLCMMNQLMIDLYKQSWEKCHLKLLKGVFVQDIYVIFNTKDYSYKLQQGQKRTVSQACSRKVDSSTR